MEPKYLVYALCDPTTHEIRYIGKSCKGMERPKEHFYKSTLKTKSVKNSWVKSVLSSGLVPEIQVLRICNDAEHASSSEIELIAHYLDLNCQLTNGTIGGSGGNTGASHKRWRPVIAQNLETRAITEYPYVRATALDGFCVTKVVSVCRGKRKSHMGFSFRYADGSTESKNICKNPRKRLPKTVIIHNDMVFVTMKAAAEYANIAPCTVVFHCQGKVKTPKFKKVLSSSLPIDYKLIK